MSITSHAGTSRLSLFCARSFSSQQSVCKNVSTALSHPFFLADRIPFQKINRNAKLKCFSDVSRGPKMPVGLNKMERQI